MGWKLGLLAFVAFIILVAYLFDNYLNGKEQAVGGKPEFGPETQANVIAAVRTICEQLNNLNEEHPSTQEDVISEGMSEGVHAEQLADGDAVCRRRTAVEASKAS